MALQLAKLAQQGRAFDSTRVFTEVEHEAVQLLIRELGLSRLVSADYVRNGIMTVEHYQMMTEAGLKPKSLEELHANVVEVQRQSVAKALGLNAEPEVKPTKAITNKKK
jgi:hypothetical protein